MMAAMFMERVPPAGSAPAVRGDRREARLRPEHAERYPGIRAGQWEPAATLADRVLAGWLLRGKDTLLGCRVLLESHFEFRGGGEGPDGGGRRPRREDR
jgi:hypothetical protein